VPASPTLTVMINAVRKASRGVQRDFGEVANLQVSVKGPANFVTAADQKCEKILRGELEKARPGYGFLMEESGTVGGTDRDHRWIIDPIDGTTNFIHSIPHFAITVALERKGELVAGVTYNPLTDELFTAEKGQGAYLNNRRLRVAVRKDLADAIIAADIPHRGEENHIIAARELARIQTRCAGIRHFGSAALDLAYVAAGRFDGYWQRNLKAWDMAAGILLVREAGGYVQDISGRGEPLETGNLVAANAELMAILETELGKGRSGAAADAA
jgi:myo-inositol-1(or 4)-monophosphatase